MITRTATTPPMRDELLLLGVSFSDEVVVWDELTVSGLLEELAGSGIMDEVSGSGLWGETSESGTIDASGAEDTGISVLGKDGGGLEPDENGTEMSQQYFLHNMRNLNL